MAITFFEYKNCSTCQKARKFLESKGVAFDSVPIVDKPPSIAQLKQMLNYLKRSGGTFKSLFNTSGQQYRELGVSQKLKDGMTEAEALRLLSQNGKLIKRPFLLTGNGGTVGFNLEQWKELL